LLLATGHHGDPTILHVLALPQYDNKGTSSEVDDIVVITKRPASCANNKKPPVFQLLNYTTPWPANFPSAARAHDALRTW
jgi:hypothetical protein